MWSQLASWKFDPTTAAVTLLVVPLVLYMLTALRKFSTAITRYTVEGLLHAASRIATQRIAASLSLKQYCRLQLEGQSRYVNVPGIVDINLDIDEIFVPLTLERTGSSTVYTHKDVPTSGTRIRIIGDPGSGKSSVAKRLFRDECTKAQRSPKTARFPMLVELRRIEIPKNISTAKLGDWLYHYLLEVAKKYAVYEIERCFSIYCNTSGILIILDGLDEVSAAAYSRMEAAINGLSATLQQMGPANVVVLTMRTQFHQQISRAFVDSFPIILSLKRFSPTDIYEFLTRWPFRLEVKSEEIVRIYNDLTDRPALREMCTNPLVLSMYVARDQASGHRLAPESRADFYTQLTEELMIRRRAKQIGIAEAQSVLRRQRQRILGKIAFDHLCNSDQPANLIPWRQGVDSVMEISKLSFDAAEQSLREIAKETGLITEEREAEAFRFIHLTFCEFLAALEAVQSRVDGWKSLMQLHSVFRNDPRTRTRLAEVIPFATALMPQYMKPQAISDVAACADSHTVALTFLEAKQYDHSTWGPFIESYRNDLLNKSHGDWDSEWLREVHLFLVIAADAERSSRLVQGIKTTDIVTPFFKFFADSKGERLSKLIANYARQDAAAAFRVSTLCGIDILSELPEVVIENADQPPFLAIALERAARESVNPEKWAALFAEAGLRSSAAAALLAAKSDRPWSNRVTSLPARHRWLLPNGIPVSLYSDCLSLAHSLVDPRTEELSLLGPFLRMKSPGQSSIVTFHSLFVSNHIAAIGILVYFAGSFLGLALARQMFPISLTVSDPGNSSPLNPRLLFALSFISVVYGVITVTYIWLERRRRMYCAVANLDVSKKGLRLLILFFPIPLPAGWIERLVSPLARRGSILDRFDPFLRAGSAFLNLRSSIRTQVAPVEGD